MADGPPISADKPDDRTPRLRRNLAALGFAVDPAGAGWDSDLTQAVMLLQKRNGLTPDGVVAKATLEVLNISPATRERQIIANLERWRWLPPTLRPTGSR